MPALNMGSPATPAANPSTGLSVLMDPLSGPKGSPFDAKQFNPTTFALEAAPTNYSTGALSTGIGFGCPHVVLAAPEAIIDAGFNDDYIPGITFPSNDVDATDCRLLYIGGGRSDANVGGIAPINHYNEQPLLNFGNGGSRDAGAGPAFTGFSTNMVTATGSVDNGISIESGWVNRSGVTMATGQSAFGSSNAPSAAVV